MNVDRPVRLAIGAAALALPAAVALARAATADTQKISFDEDFAPEVSNDICPFPVTVSGHQTGFTIVSDSTVQTHFTEQDVFRQRAHSDRPALHRQPVPEHLTEPLPGHGCDREGPP